MNAESIREAIRRRYPTQECAVMFEVPDGTGAHTKRHADAVVMNLWPSRGLTVEGFEIKISFSDLKRELLNPEKAEAIAQHCDCWWVIVPSTLKVELETIPIGWGLMSVAEDLKITVVRQAPRHERPPVFPRHFVAALLRAGQAARIRHDNVALQEAVKKRVDEEMAWERTRMERAADGTARVAALLADAGINLDHWNFSPEKAAAAVKAVLDLQTSAPALHQHLAAADAHARSASTAMAALFDAMGAQPPEVPSYFLPEAPRRRRRGLPPRRGIRPGP